MLRVLVVFAALFSVSAFAHVDLGFYDGVRADGSACSFEIQSIAFDGVPSPFNERVTVAFEGATWVLSHAASVDTDTASLSFEHGRLSAVKGVRGGAHGLAIQMIHSEAYTGPVSLTFVADMGSTGEKHKFVCSQLKHRD